MVFGMILIFFIFGVIWVFGVFFIVGFYFNDFCLVFNSMVLGV